MAAWHEDCQCTYQGACLHSPLNTSPGLPRYRRLNLWLPHGLSPTTKTSHLADRFKLCDITPGLIATGECRQVLLRLVHMALGRGQPTMPCVVLTCCPRPQFEGSEVAAPWWAAACSEWWRELPADITLGRQALNLSTHPAHPSPQLPLPSPVNFTLSVLDRGMAQLSVPSLAPRHKYRAALDAADEYQLQCTAEHCKVGAVSA